MNSITPSSIVIGVMGRRPGPEVNEERPMNLLEGTLALQGREEVRYSLMGGKV